MRGVLVYRPRLKGSNGDRGLYTFEFNPNDRYPYETIKKAYELLIGKSAELRGRLGYYPMPAALIRYHEEKDLYDDAPFRVYLDEDLFGDIDYLPLNPGAHPIDPPGHPDALSHWSVPKGEEQFLRASGHSRTSMVVLSSR